jgi:hypothetical protein
MSNKVKGLFLLVLFLLSSTFAYAQEDWQENEGGNEINCALLVQIDEAISSGNSADLISLANQPFFRLSDGSETTLSNYLGSLIIVTSAADLPIESDLQSLLRDSYATCQQEDTPAGGASLSGETFTVVVDGNVNLRGCAGTDCDIVGQASDGELLTVIGQEGDWYEVETDDGTAFIASFLTTRGPDAVIQTDEAYLDVATGCIIVFDIRRGDSDLRFIISGDGRNDVVVDIFRPNENNPLPVQGQLDKTFIDTGEPYIDQYYRFNTGWSLGVYQIELQYNGEISRVAWEMEDRGEYNIFVVCT